MQSWTSRFLTLFLVIITLVLTVSGVLIYLQPDSYTTDQKEKQRQTNLETLKKQLSHYMAVYPQHFHDIPQDVMLQIGTSQECRLTTAHCVIDQADCLDLTASATPSGLIAVDFVSGTVQETGFALKKTAPGTFELTACHSTQELAPMQLIGPAEPSGVESL